MEKVVLFAIIFSNYPDLNDYYDIKILNARNVFDKKI